MNDLAWKPCNTCLFHKVKIANGFKTHICSAYQPKRLVMPFDPMFPCHMHTKQPEGEKNE